MHQQTRHRPASLAYCPFATGHHQILIIQKPNWLLQLGPNLTLYVLNGLSPPPPQSHTFKAYACPLAHKMGTATSGRPWPGVEGGSHSFRSATGWHGVYSSAGGENRSGGLP